MYSKIIPGSRHKVGTPVEVKTFLDCDARALTREESELFIKVSLAENMGEADLFDTICAESPCAQITADRLSHFPGPGASKPAIVICDLWSKGVPGHAVLWAFNLFVIGRLTGNEVSSMDLVSYICNGNGIPTEDAVHECWDSQKGFTHGLEFDNLLDAVDWRALTPPPAIETDLYLSMAQWPYPAVNLGLSRNVSDDKHATESAAEAVCERLALEGFGGEGKIFPIATWVEPVAKTLLDKEVEDHATA